MALQSARTHLIWLLILSAALIGGSACGPDVAAPVDDGEETDFDAPAPTGTVRDQLWEKFPDQAIESVPAARALWEESEPDQYLFEIGYESIGFLEIEVVGGVPGEPVKTGDIDAWSGDTLPRTVDEAFDELDAILERSFENPADEDSCQGTFFNMRFNTDVGHPTYYDTLGPCDDGIGVTIRVTAT